MNIESIYEIINRNINYNNYFESLMGLLYKYNLVDNSKIIEFNNVLIYKLRKYTGGNYNSIDINIAKRIRESIIYTFNLFFENKDIKDNINMIINNDLMDIYKLSYKKLYNYFNKTKMFYNIVFKKNIISTSNYCYNMTLIKALKEYFKIYNYDYDALNNIITLDYREYNKIKDKDGIMLIDEYLRNINCENIICKKYNINNLYKMYNDYDNEVINIYESVMIISLMLEFENKDIFNLDIDDIDINYMYEMYKRNSYKYKIELNIAFDRMKDKLLLDVDSIKYMDRSKDNLISVIIMYTESNNLDKLFKDNDNKIEYVSKERMSSSDYNKLIDKIKYSNDKVNIITMIESFYDMIYVIESVYLSKSELYKLFDSFDIMNILVFRKWYSDNDSYVKDIFFEYLGNRKDNFMVNKYYKYIDIK